MVKLTEIVEEVCRVRDGSSVDGEPDEGGEEDGHLPDGDEDVS